MDNKLQIINYLARNHEQQFTMHQLSKLLNIPYASFYRTIKELSDLLITKKMGKATTLCLNLHHPTLKCHLAIAADEMRKEYLTKYPIIKKITHDLNPNDIVLLFGSYAKETATSRSDIDLLIINNGKQSTSFAKHELLYKKKINPLYVSRKEFQQLLKVQEENVGKEALKHHIVLQHLESFWEVTLDAIR